MWPDNPRQTIEYRMVGFHDEHQFDSQDTWEWVVYAGEDGSILAHVPVPAARGRQAWVPPGAWVRLGQTRNEDGYWLVSIRGKNGPKQYRVSLLVEHAFHDAPLQLRRSVVMHLDSDKDNNEPSNLQRGTQKLNRAHESDASVKERKKRCRSSLDNLKISLLFNSKACTGTLETSLRLPEANSCTGTAPGTIVDTLLYRYAWALRGVTDLYVAMPEKRQAVFHGLPSRETDCGACCPIGFGANEMNPTEFIERNSEVYLQHLRAGQNWLPYSSRFPAESNRTWIFSGESEIPDW